MAAITKLVVETVREREESDFTHHDQTLEMGTTKVREKTPTLPDTSVTGKICGFFVLMRWC